MANSVCRYGSATGSSRDADRPWADEMLSRFKEEKKQSAQSAMQLAAQKNAEIEKISLRLQRLLDSFLDGVIDRNDYTAEKAKLMSRKKTL